MAPPLSRREIFLTSLFLVIFAGACYFTLSKFGSASGFHGSASAEFRVLARHLIAITSIIGIFILPRRKIVPRINLYYLAALLGLIAWGAFMVYNWQYDLKLFEFIWHKPESRPFGDLPGTFAFTTSLGYLYEVFVLLLASLMIARCLETSAWKGILAVLAALGLAVVIIGLGHKTLGIESVWNVASNNKPDTFFAPFVYNANAASFLNLTFMIALGLALGLRSSSEQAFRILCAVAALIAIGIIATASKAGFLILFLQTILFLLLQYKAILNAKRKFRPNRKSGLQLERRIAVGLVVIIFLTFSIGSIGHLFFRVQTMVTEIESTGASSTVEGRIEYIDIMTTLIKTPDEVDWHGFGPGTFAHVMIWYIKPEHTVGRSDFGHCDPLQTIVEWGYPGAFLWFFIGLGAIVRALHLLETATLTPEKAHLIKALICALFGVGLHSLIDFPLSIFSIHLTAILLCAILWSIRPDPSESTAHS